jgi:creatinine amidohydrolase
MRIQDLNWMQVEEYLKGDDRIVIPLGCTEQHAYLSLATDSILAERISTEAAEPTGVLVMPALPYGLTPWFAAYPGSPTLRDETYAAVLRDLLDSLNVQGFRRFLFVNGHGGNNPAQAAVENWQAANPGTAVLWHNWWNAPGVWQVVQEIDPVASHASWLENFPWTRLPDVAQPDEQKPLQDWDSISSLEPKALREALGDGSFGGRYQRSDEEMQRVWDAGVEEVRTLLTRGFQ